MHRPLLRRIGTLARLLREGRGSVAARTAFRSFPWPALFYANTVLVVRLWRAPRLLRPLDHVQVRRALPDDAGALRAVTPHRRGRFTPFDRGHLCLLASVGDRPAAYNWYRFDTTHRSGANHYAFELPAGACWAYGLVVHPEHRMSGAFVKLWSEAMRLLGERGYRAIYGTIEEDNLPSVNAHLRTGFEIVCRYSVLRFLGLSFHRVETPEGRVRRGMGLWTWRDPGPPINPPSAVPL